MVVRALLLALTGICLGSVPGCGAKAPEAPPPNASPLESSAASRRYARPEYQQALGKDGKVLWKPGMKIPPGAGAAAKP